MTSLPYKFAAAAVRAAIPDGGSRLATLPDRGKLHAQSQSCSSYLALLSVLVSFFLVLIFQRGSE